MKRQRLLRPRSISDHEQAVHDDARRLHDQKEFSIVQMKIYDDMPRFVRDRAKDNTAVIRRYYGL